jgi:hypothetical protein
VNFIRIISFSGANALIMTSSQKSRGNQQQMFLYKNKNFLPIDDHADSKTGKYLI